MNGSYAEASSAIYNFLQELQGNYAADVTLLGFGKLVTNLSAAETKFLTYRDERSKEDAAKPKEHLLKIRKEADEYYKSMTSVLYASLMADGLGGDVAVSPDSLKTGIYEDGTPEEQKGNVVYNFVFAWNAILKRYQTMLAARVGRSKAKDKEPDPDEDDGPVED